MNNKLEFKRFFAYSEEKHKSFYTEFINGSNIIYGKNTSGKSTLIHALLYTFGINDEKGKLSDLLKENVIFRIDIILHSNTAENITIVREDETIIISRENKPRKKFIGISGNRSEEHKSLKHYLGEIFDFNLHLESSGKYQQAPIEAMFLPYYIAQDVGWVYRHKSFRGLDFIKNFKRDFFDYYLGIVNDYDRNQKNELDKAKEKLKNEIEFLTNIESQDLEIKLSKLKDEKYVTKSLDYLKIYKENKEALIVLEKDYLITHNKLALLENRKNVLFRVRKALKNQDPIEDDCPTCHQELPESLEKIYEYHQDYLDTEDQIEENKRVINKLKTTSGKINSLNRDIAKYKEIIAKDYATLENYNLNDLSLNTWIENKVNIQFSSNVTSKIGEKTIELKEIEKKLEIFKTDDEIEDERKLNSSVFRTLFKRNLKELKVKEFDDHRFLRLYEIPAFPRQGVELLKTLLAYNFAFNNLIKDTEGIHRFPFLLDAIFEGDLEADSKDIILKFIGKYKPTDTQLFVSIADSKKNKISVNDYNTKYFNGKANLICIGNNKLERAFLSDHESKFDEYLNETFDLLIETD
ncbi:hypothetical protein [Gillisia hiemivivida]|uniref:Uncharacterized protein n=1 Tax=Gillisia hiemivivida TaxID=291190 RepID=A0A5C7A4A5_9FLAO|nr:hypothetical protein [Gillisia hiemivivida]TXD95669.1 hypothetical protein ES724_01155 [Gillisia hiemivivida]